VMLQIGVTGAAFDALRPGTAALTSARYPCRVHGPAPATAQESAPPTHCGAIMAFRVTLVVS
jgi:hypothetical protein